MEQAAAQRLLIAFVPQPNQMTKMHRRVAAATTTRIFAGATLLLLVVHCSGSAWTPASPPNRGWGSIPTQRQLDLGTFSLVLATISTASSSSSSVLRASSQPQSPSGDASPSSLVRQGMTAFRQGQVAESIAYFDKAEQLSYSYSLTPYLWQRGLSYFYTNDFEAASRQFRTDVRVNPNDTEEIVWDIASQLRQQQQRIGSGSSTGATAMSVFPIPNQLSLPSGTKDGRKIMQPVYRLFRGEGTEQDLAKAGHAAGKGSPDEFYALFYLGLFCEARGEASKAEAYLRQAVQTRYGQLSNDYMAACAKVHCQLRGWT